LAERAEEDVDDPAGGLDVSARYSGAGTGVHERTLGRRDVDRRKGAGRSGHVRVGQAANDEIRRRARYGQRTVEVPVVLRRGPGEVDLELVPRDGDHGPKLELALHGLEDVRSFEAPVGQALDSGPDDPFRVREQLVHRFADAVCVVPGA
jgi:hypothetical protein